MIKKKKTCLLIDIAVPQTEKLSKYKDLEMEISRIRKVKTKILPVIIGALGTIKKGLDKNLQLLPGHPSAAGLQKITLMSTAHIFPKVLE